MNMIEIWKDVVGYEDYFQVSNTGKIFSKRTNKELKLRVNEKGYNVLATKIGGRTGKNICLRVHVLVASAFIPNPENKPTVNHVDGVKSNNVISNLEWATISEQLQHAHANRLIVNKKGTESLLASFTDDQVKFIREHHIPRHPKYGVRAMARSFGVSHKTVADVINGVRY